MHIHLSLILVILINNRKNISTIYRIKNNWYQTKVQTLFILFHIGCTFNVEKQAIIEIIPNFNPVIFVYSPAMYKNSIR